MRSHLVPMDCWLIQLHPTVHEVHELVRAALTECTVHRHCQIKSHNHTLHQTCLSSKCPACRSEKWHVCLTHSSLAISPETLKCFLKCFLFFYTTDIDRAFGYKIQKTVCQKLSLSNNKPYICRSIVFKYDLTLQSFFIHSQRSSNSEIKVNQR